MIHAVPENVHPLPDGPHQYGSMSEVAANMNVIVTMAYGRAGSILIQSLFDGHPNVLTLPHLGPMYSLLPASIRDLDPQIDWFINRFPTIFDTSRDTNEFAAAKFGPSGDVGFRVSSTKFKEHLMGLAIDYCTIDPNRQLSRKEFFVLVHVAYALCVRSFNITDIKYLFYHVHSYVHAEWQHMLEDFPQLYFIGMTRDPRQDWTSWKKIHALRMQRDIGDVPPICLFLSEYHYSKSSYELSNLVEKLKPDHIRIIDLEDLHVLNKNAMTHLCSWLNIEFDECLMQSTINGLEWHGNAANGKRAPAFNPNMIQDAWRSELADHDRQLICSLVPGSLRYLGYDKENPADGIGSENIIGNLKYKSNSQLFIHCTLYLSGNPIERFRNSWRKKRVSKIRAIRSLAGDVYRGARLFLELRGDGVDRKTAEIVTQQKQLLQRHLPLSLFVASHINQNPSSIPIGTDNKASCLALDR